MTTPPAICAILVCVLFCVTRTCVGRIPGCAEENALYGECKYGTYKDHCGMTVCSKGPGERCGGRFERMGKCASSLTCRCERCLGCVVPVTNVNPFFESNPFEIRSECYDLEYCVPSDQ